MNATVAAPPSIEAARPGTLGIGYPRVPALDYGPQRATFGFDHLNRVARIEAAELRLSRHSEACGVPLELQLDERDEWRVLRDYGAGDALGASFSDPETAVYNAERNL